MDDNDAHHGVVSGQSTIINQQSTNLKDFREAGVAVLVIGPEVSQVQFPATTPAAPGALLIGW